MLDDLVRLVVDRTGAPVGLVTLVPGGHQIIIAESTTGDLSADAACRPTDALARQAVDRADVVALPDVRLSVAPPGPLRSSPVRAYAAAPVLSRDGAVLGVVSAAAPAPRGWSDAHLTVLRDAAALVGHSLSWRNPAEPLPGTPLGERLAQGVLADLIALARDLDVAEGRGPALIGVHLTPAAPAPSGIPMQLRARVARQIGEVCRWGDPIWWVRGDALLVACSRVGDLDEAREIAHRLRLTATHTARWTWPGPDVAATVVLAAAGDHPRDLLAAVLDAPPPPRRS